MAQAGAPFFDPLEDEVVQDIIRRIHKAAQPFHGKLDTSCLAATCRRLCTLVRRTRQVCLIAGSEGALLLARAPPHRAFHHVVRLELRYTDVTDIQHWALYGEAAAAAATTWLGLEQVELAGGLTAGVQAGEPGGIAPALLALRHAPALRRLQLDLPDQFSLVYLAALTQLTHLELRSWDFSLVVHSATHSRPLSEMPHLVSLELQGMVVNEDLPCALAPNLTRLEMQNCWSNGDDGDWWAHVAGCQHLRELVVEGDLSCFITLHPTMLLQAIAGQLTGLVHLRIERDFRGIETDVDSQVTLTDMIEEMLLVAGMFDEDVGSWMPTPPLLGQLFCGAAVAYTYVIVPPPNMGALTSLQHLSLTDWWLVVSSEAYWRALAGCSSLRSLGELHAAVPPPAGVTFPHLTELVATVSTSPGDTVTLLGAFPALRELQLTVAPQVITPTQEPSGQAKLDHLITAGITLLYPLGGAPLDDPYHSLVGYCNALYGSLTSLRSLHLEWPPHAHLLERLPCVSTLQQLTALQLGTNHEMGTFALPQWVLWVVQGATQLQQLGMWLELGPTRYSDNSKEELLWRLQQELPQLKVLGLRGGDRGTAAADMWPGLKVVCAWSER